MFKNILSWWKYRKFNNSELLTMKDCAVKDYFKLKQFNLPVSVYAVKRHKNIMFELNQRGL